jgi:hypothetical protein
VITSNNADEGIVLTATFGKSSNRNQLSNLTTSNNGGFGIVLGGANDNTLTNLSTYNNGNSGLLVSPDSGNNRFAHVAANNNLKRDRDTPQGGRGLEIECDNCTFLGVTAGNHTFAGVNLAGSADNNTLMGVAVTNAAFGFFLTGSNNALSDVSSASNALEGFTLINSSNNRFTGILEVGNNMNFDGQVINGTDPGLEQPDCDLNGTSDFFRILLVDLAGSFVGRVTSDDTKNTSDSNGAAAGFPANPDTFDWAGFDNVFRGWGLDTAPYRHRWTTSVGRIWDRNLSSTDNGAAPGGCASPPCPALLGIGEVAALGVLPYGDATLTHAWHGMPASTDNAGCDAMVTGSVWNGAACQTMLLRNAREIQSDGIGNDNTLCESNETCLYMPNIGSYQGHLASAGAFTDGTLTGITLMRYASNGR